MPVSRQIDRDGWSAERGNHQIPGVGVLPAAVQEHQFWVGLAPDQDADLLFRSDLDGAPAHWRDDYSVQPEFDCYLAAVNRTPQRR